MEGYRITFPSGGASAGVHPDVTLAPAGTVIPVQTHSCNVAVVEPDGPLPQLDDTDAIISLRPGLTIGVRTADCVPVLLHAPDISAVAAVHAGWKGSLHGIVTATVAMLCDMGARPALLEAAFGPCICGACYEVSTELADEFRAAGFGRCITGTRLLDLEAVNRQRLVDSGLLPGNIQPTRLCTMETPGLPSWHRHPTGQRLLTWIRL